MAKRGQFKTEIGRQTGVFMCGRFTQYQSEVRYLERLNYQHPIAFEPNDEPISRYNIAPSTHVQVIVQEEEAARFSSLRWGYLPHWAKGQPSINARREKAASSPYWRAVWPNRCLVPADGWFEWVKDESDPKRKLPFYIYAANSEPLLLAAIGSWAERGAEPREHDGFAIITADSEGGMVDIHDRRPVALTPELAREWLDPATPKDRAEEIIRSQGSTAEAFNWYPVSKAVGNVRNQGKHLIDKD